MACCTRCKRFFNEAVFSFGGLPFLSSSLLYPRPSSRCYCLLTTKERTWILVLSPRTRLENLGTPVPPASMKLMKRSWCARLTGESYRVLSCYICYHSSTVVMLRMQG